jgi:hypothetical protein
MTDAERKAVVYIVRLATDMVVATLGNTPVWDARDRLREGISQRVAGEIALLNSPGALAEWVIAANSPASEVGGV